MSTSVFYLKVVFIILVVFNLNATIFAQQVNNDKYYVNNNRNWLIEIPIWFPGFRGQLAYGDYDFSSSNSGSENNEERLKNDFGIEFYFVGRIVTRYRKLWISTDAFSGKVSKTFSYTSLIGTEEREVVDITVHGTIPRLVLGYSVWQKTNKGVFKVEAIPYVGLRYTVIDLQSDVFDLTEIIDIKPSWLEPIFGLYIPIDYKRFKIEIQADYGAINSNHTYTISNRYRYRASKLVDLQLGWNLIRLYHEGTYDNQKLETAIRLLGPTAGIGFRF